MRFRRLRFSARTLLVAVFLVAAMLGSSVRFGPHLMWKIGQSDISHGVVPIPSKPLVAVPPNEKLVTCNVGPVSFELPETMANDVGVRRGIGGVFLQFNEADRSLHLQLPHRYRGGLLQHEIAAFPDKSKMTFSRLYKEIADAQSADFSFGMSKRELRWHKWMLTTRATIGNDIDHIEYLWRPDLEGNLIFYNSSSMHTFHWSTTDRQWEGMTHFECSSRHHVDWVRHLCTSFVIKGNPSVFDSRDDASIESMITFTPLPERGRTSR